MARIFFFSGSGNSLCVAKLLAEKLDAEISSIPVYLRAPFTVTDSVIGVVTPVHCTELPPLVRRFLETVIFRLLER